MLLKKKNFRKIFKNLKKKKSMKRKMTIKIDARIFSHL